MATSLHGIQAVCTIIVAGTALAAASATGSVARTALGNDACAKTIHAMGAELGRAEEKGAEGALAYRFVVRTNGVDYDVICDAATGVVRDVALRGAQAPN
jgi:hypothetical protein